MCEVWCPSRQYLRHNCSLGLGKSMQNSYQLSKKWEALHLLSHLVICLFTESLDDDNVFKGPCL